MQGFDFHAAALVAVIAAVTALLRFAPFAVFGGGRPTPRYILYLGRVLPCAIMAMLVVYCLRGADPLGPTHALPELLAGAAVVGLHLWRKNTLLSIAGGHRPVYGAGAGRLWIKEKCRPGGAAFQRVEKLDTLQKGEQSRTAIA